jgi:hypothetical protein
MDRVAELTAGDLAADRLTIFAAGLRKRQSVPFLLTYLRTAQIYAPDCGMSRLSGFAHDPTALGTLPRDFEETLHALLAHVAEPMRATWGSGFALGLCRCCAVLPGLADLLRRPVFLAAPPLTSFSLLRFLVRRFYDEAQPDLESWAEYRRELLDIESSLDGVPPSHHPKYISLYEEIRSSWRDPAFRARRRATVHAVVRRLARPPFHWNDCASDGLVSLIEASDVHPQRLLSAPDASFRRLEDACRHGNRRRFLVPGLAALAAWRPGLVLEAFAHHPDALMRAATRLGSVSPPRRTAVLRRFRSHPVMHRSFMKRPIAEICGLLGGWSGTGGANPIPRKLRLHLETGLALSDGSLERHRQTIARRLTLVRLELLRDSVLRELAAGLPKELARDENGRHALVLLGSIDRNRRLLRRLLASYDGSRRAFALEHAANRAWLARHPRLDVDVWTQGIAYERDVAGHGRLRVEVEQDPLEALKLGTYVSSCLGVGGLYDYSAVCVVADINKQVLYARRRDGTVVGRQVVAITEQDQIAFFSVYPIPADGGLEEAFLDFDLAFAKRLGLEPFAGDDAPIALIVAGDWWDDGVWSRITPERLALASTRD